VALVISGCGGGKATKPAAPKPAELKRDYSSHDHMKKMPPGIFSADDAPWIDIDATTRRKVLFSDRLTVEIVESQKSVLTKNITTEHRFNDTLGYIMAGSAMVTVGKETKQIPAGGAFVVPSNTPYGVIPASDKTTIIYAYTPPREDLRPNAPAVRRFPDNEIKSIVYKWFALFDEKAFVGDFLTYLAETGLSIEMADKKKINSWAQFQEWYAKWTNQVDSFTSTVESLAISFDPKTGHYKARASVSSTTKTHSGKRITGNCQVDMDLVDTNWGDAPKIITYKETEIKK
jgi:mannose-6-phosphate isomerase-like protein (cupin superfamily)